ncbi:hypothetical protein Tco_0200032 [Tanacetum coccineum]
MYYPRFTKVIIHYFLTQDKTLSWRNKIRMHTSKDDYLINTLRFVSAREETQIYGAILPESLTSPEMKETKAYKTYLGFAIVDTPPNKARNFKKPASPKLTTVPASTEEPTGKSKRVKRPAKKSTQAPARGVVIRETPKIPVSKKKEKVDVASGKGIELLSDVALTEEAQYEEVRKKSLRDFHKTHPSGSGIATKPTLSDAIIKPSITNEGTGVKSGVPDVTEEESSKSKAESWGNDDDDSNNDQASRSEESDQDKDNDDDKSQSDNEDESDSEHEIDDNESGFESDQEEDDEKIKDDEEEEEDEIVKTPSNDSDGEDKTKIADKAEGDEDEEMDYTTSLLYDDVDIRMNEPVNADKGFVQDEGTDAVMTNVQQGNENPEISQVIEDAHVTLSTVPQKAVVPVSSSSRSSDLAAKFLNFSNIPTTKAGIVSLLDVPVYHEVPSQQTPTLLTVPVSVISDSSHVFSTVIQQSLQLGVILPEVVSNIAPPKIERMVTELLEHAILAKESSQPQSSYEAAATLTEFELKKILIDKMDKSESYLAAPKHRECYEGLIKYYDLDKSLFFTYDRGLKKIKTSMDAEPTKGPKAKESQSGSSKGTKSQPKSSVKFVQSEEPEFEVADSDMPQDQEEKPSNDDVESKKKTLQQVQNQSWLMTLASYAEKPSKTFNGLMSTPIDFSAFIMNGSIINNLTQETLLGPAFRLLKGTRSNYAKLEYDFEEYYKDLSEKLDWENLEGGDYPFDLTKPLPLVMSRNRQKALKTWFQIYGSLLKLPMINMHYGESHTKENNVEVMRKHRYGYLKEIILRRAYNDLYKFKEGDFPHLRNNDIEDMLLFVVQNWLINLSGDDVSDFAIALRMFTRSLVIHKRVEDLQLRVESYQKKINFTRPQTTISGIRKRDPYTPYQDPQGFIYVDNNGRNRLMRSDELYKFSDRTLTGLRTSLDDITNNIRMEYLPKRHWSTLEKKRANIMIKAIDKKLKERRLMRSLEKFVGGRHYGTGLQLLQ